MNLAHLYFIHFGVSALLIICSFKSNTTARNFIAIYIFIFLVISRQFEYKQDLLTYYKWATWGFYTYREPVFPYLNSLTYDVLNWRNIYFFSDAISVLIIRGIFQRLNLHHNYMLIFFCFFPVIMGFQSIYRQFFGTLICLYIISLVYETSEQKTNYFGRMNSLLRNFLAIASHNTHGLSVLVIKISHFRFLQNFVVSAVIGTIIALFFDLFRKANQDTGGTTVMFYLIILLILSICFYLNNDKIGLNLGVSGFTIISIMWISGFETPSERVGLTFLVLLFISLIYFLERYKPRAFVRLMFLSLGFFPLYVSSAHTLLTESYFYG